LVNTLGKADLHIHSKADDGLATPRQIVDYVEEHTDLDVIAITDHDEIAGALEARDIVAQGHYRFQVLVGTEVTTRQGHLLALGIERPIRMLQEMDRSIELIHEQGGICVLPHPMAWFSMGARQSLVNRLVREPTASVYLDGVEVFNPSFAGRVVFKLAERLNRTRWHLAACGGSDSHSLNTIGSAYTTFPGERTIEGLRRALSERTTGYAGSFWTVSDHTSIAIPQLYRSMIVTPVARIRRTRGLLREEELAGRGDAPANAERHKEGRQT
jgi:predicted metal-dependent phosphoesterase TrpH